LQLAHDLRHHLVDALRLDRPLAQRDLHRAQELVAVERDAAPVALDHRESAQLDALERAAAEIAGEAHAPAADHRRVLGRPGILALCLAAPAARTAHCSPEVRFWLHFLRQTGVTFPGKAPSRSGTGRPTAPPSRARPPPPPRPPRRPSPTGHRALPRSSR